MFSRFKTNILLVDLAVLAFFASFRNKSNITYLAQDYDVSYHRFWPIKKFIDLCYWYILGLKRIFTISVSHELAKKLEKYNPSAVLTISNCVNLDTFYSDPKSPYLQKREKSFVILLFAREDYRKGLDIAVKALQVLRDISGTDWEIWTIGEKKVEIEKVYVKHFGFIGTDKELREILSAIDIYLVPSRSEGLSLLLLQALACQCVVVSTSASAIIQNEVNGLISSVEDARALAENVQRVMVDDKLRSQLKDNARKLADQYSLKKSCEQFEKALVAFCKN